MNYSVIAFFKDRLSSEHTIFEYGSGNSTAFWAKRAKSVLSVEHDRGWFEKVKARIPSNVEILYRPETDLDAYVSAISHSNSDFDLIIIDGIARDRCLREAIPNLSKFGVIVLDDSDRKEWQGALEFVQSLGFKQIKFAGLKPTGFGVDQTSILYRRENCLGI
jgi:hypothetical protein